MNNTVAQQTRWIASAWATMRSWFTRRRHWRAGSEPLPPAELTKPTQPEPVGEVGEVGDPDVSADSANSADFVPIVPIVPQQSFTILAKDWEETTLDGATAADTSIGYRHAVDIHDVLDKLPEYFDDLRALRDLDRDSYNMFTLVGAQIPTQGTLLSFDRIDPDFLENPPTVRSIFFSDGLRESDDGETIYGRIFYAIKLAPARIFVTSSGTVLTPKDGTTYRLSGVYRPKNGTAVGMDCFINIHDGIASVVPERRHVQQLLRNTRKLTHMPPKKGRRYKRDNSTGGVVIHDRVVIPDWVKEVAARQHRSPNEFAHMMLAALSSAKRPDNAILVRAERDGLTASWTIDRRDAKRFFRKRQRDGDTRKRILHYVAPFERLVGNNTQHVRAHYRGNRSFEWMGYTVAISGLGFHHDDFFDAPIDHFDPEDHPPGVMCSIKRIARSIRQRYNKPVFLTPKRKRAA